jgi:TolB-like protein/Tfp pilus assembly protein PilF
MLPEAGRTLSHYRLIEKIGEGGMGVVWKALDTRLDREVAIKLLPDDFADDPERLARFKQEAKAVAALSHPNILAIYDVGAEEGLSFAVMELLEGETLRERLRGAAPAWRKTAEIGAAIADGLAAAHSKGIIHRDLKPENVFITTDGVVKILDFGLVRRERAISQGEKAAAPTVTVQTSPGAVMGTLTYMSPEQLRGEPGDARSDIFALGCLLYEMAAGKKAFSRATASETMAAILKEEPSDISAERKEIPAELERVIQHALEKRPEERFQSARDLAFGLRSVESGTAPSRKVYWIAALSLVVVAAAVMLGLLYFGGPSPGERIESLAILPFTNEGGDPDTEFLAEEIPASIINSLSRLENLRVVPRDSVAHYAARSDDNYSLAREMDVAALLTGRITVRGGSLSISAELVDVANDRQIWGERYSEELSDILSIEADISKRISDELRLRLSGDEKDRLSRGYTENAEAHLAYLQGRFWWNKRTRESYDKAIASFDEAIRIDPDYALAYAGKADCYALLAMHALVPGDFIHQAREAAEKALALDDTLAEAHASMGWIRWIYDWDWEAAEESFERAIRLNPRYPTARNWYGAFLAAMGRGDEAIEQIKRARQLDPGSLIINRDLGVVYSWIGQSDLAIEQLLKTIEMDPQFLPARSHLGRVYFMAGRYDEAIAELEIASDLAKDVIHSGSLGLAYAMAGRREAALRVLEMLTETAKQQEVASYQFAIVHMGLGNRDEAFEWLERSYANREFPMAILKFSESMGSIRDDPRFDDLLRRIGFPEQSP